MVGAALLKENPHRCVTGCRNLRTLFKRRAVSVFELRPDDMQPVGLKIVAVIKKIGAHMLERSLVGLARLWASPPIADAKVRRTTCFLCVGGHRTRDV